jgi:hypothetical protein
MPTKRPFNLRLDTDLVQALLALRERDGIPASEAIRRVFASMTGEAQKK